MLSFTAWKVSKYGVFSSRYFPLFGLNTKIYSVIQRFTIWTFFTQCFCIIVYSFVCQHSLHYYWYWYNQKQSSSAALQKRCSFKFHKIHKKTPKKRFRFRYFLVNSAKFPITSLLKNASDGYFSINARYVYCPTSIQKRCHTYYLAEYFFGLICRLGQEWAQYFKLLARSLFEHLRLSFFGKNSLQLKTVKYFREKAPLWCSTRF